MKTVVEAIREADHPDNHGNGYLLVIKTKSGDVFRGGVMSKSPEEVEKSGVVKLDLWQGKPNGDGPIGVDASIELAKVAEVEIEW